MGDDQPLLILVCGPEGSGKTSFMTCFKNAFLQSLPVFPLYQGILGHISFAAECTLADSETLPLLIKAKNAGYKITIYFLLAGKTISLYRCRLSSLVSKAPFLENALRKDYEKSFRGLFECFDFADLIFFVRNQKNFEFLSAFEPSKTNKADFYNALLEVKKSVDLLK